MVKISLVKGLGRSNPNYYTTVVVPEVGDYHYRNVGYMPRHTEICDLIEKLVSCEPPDKRSALTKKFMSSILKGNVATVLNPNKSSKRIYLRVSFAMKDKAKGLGAKWDFIRKKWYVSQESTNKDILIKLFA